MAISSIHIESGKIGFFSHNDRSRKTQNSIFFDEPNYYSCSSKNAIGLYKNELLLRTNAYLKKHPVRKKLHSKTITHLSAIINLNKHHNEQDLKKVCDYLEQTLDTKVLQYSIHRDEGHIDKIKNEPIKNYHAHIECMGLDSKGNSVRRKLSKKYLSNLQTEVAVLLKMERGTNYIKEKKNRSKRLGTYEYKKAKEQETNSVLANQKHLKNEIANIRAELQNNKATRAEYRLLELLHKSLKQKVKNKDLTIESLNNELTQYHQGFQNDTDNQKNTIQQLEQEKIEAEQVINSVLPQDTHNKYSFINKIKGFVKIIKDLKIKIKEFKELIIHKDNTIQELQQNNTHLKNVILETGDTYNDGINIKSTDDNDVSFSLAP